MVTTPAIKTNAVRVRENFLLLLEVKKIRSHSLHSPFYLLQVGEEEKRITYQRIDNNNNNIAICSLM
jgi:hypothetical protein